MAVEDGLRKEFVAAAGIAADLRTCSVAATAFQVVGLLIDFACAAAVAVCTVGLQNCLPVAAVAVCMAGPLNCWLVAAVFVYTGRPPDLTVDS